MATAPIQVTISNNKNVGLATGGTINMISANTLGVQPIFSANYHRKLLGLDTDRIASFMTYEDRPSPSRCRERRGGPRSTIFCEQFKAGSHSEHVGRSSTGRWYTWSNDEK